MVSAGHFADHLPSPKRPQQELDALVLLEVLHTKLTIIFCSQRSSACKVRVQSEPCLHIKFYILSIGDQKKRAESGSCTVDGSSVGLPSRNYSDLIPGQLLDQSECNGVCYPLVDLILKEENLNSPPLIALFLILKQ